MKFEISDIQAKSIRKRPITACKQYCLAAGATQGNIAYTQNVKINHITSNIPTLHHQQIAFGVFYHYLAILGGTVAAAGPVA